MSLRTHMQKEKDGQEIKRRKQQELAKAFHYGRFQV